MPAHLTEAEARALGIGGVAAAPKRSTRKEVTGEPYHTRCACGEEFRSQRAEDAHVSAGHVNFQVVIDD